MSEYPKALMRNDDGPDAVKWGGEKVTFMSVDDAAAEAAARNDGWRGTSESEADAPEPTLLDRSAKEIEAALVDLSADEIEALLEGERAGKTRKGVVAMLEAAMEKALA